LKTNKYGLKLRSCSPFYIKIEQIEVSLSSIQTASHYGDGKSMFTHVYYISDKVESISSV